MNPNWRDYQPFFEESEFVCKCGCGKSNMTKEHMDMLLSARIIAGVPFVINSGCRCAVHNKLVGGSKTSDHVGGYGTDIQARSGRATWIIDSALVKAGFDRIGQGRTFLHAGNDPKNPPRVRWSY